MQIAHTTHHGGRYMQIVIATDSYKGSLTSKKVAECIELGIRKYNNQIKIIKGLWRMVEKEPK